MTDQQAQVDTWNAQHPIGTPVRYWPGAREGQGTPSRTRSRAEVLSGHTAVVWVEDEGACIALSHVDPAPDVDERRLARRGPLDPAPESRLIAHRRTYPWSPCDTCPTPFTCEKSPDLDRCP